MRILDTVVRLARAEEGEEAVSRARAARDGRLSLLPLQLSANSFRVRPFYTSTSGLRHRAAQERKVAATPTFRLTTRPPAPASPP